MTTRRLFLKAVAAFAVASNLPGFESAAAVETIDKVKTLVPEDVLANAIVQQRNDIVPIGYVISFVPTRVGNEGLRPPVIYLIKSDTGWEPCIGQALANSEFPKLCQVIDGAYGKTETTFNMPDCRGMLSHDYTA